LSKKASKTTQIKGKKKLKLNLNLNEVDAIKSCLPDFMPYLNDLNL
jgi:hypothetical protein